MDRATCLRRTSRASASSALMTRCAHSSCVREAIARGCACVQDFAAFVSDLLAQPREVYERQQSLGLKSSKHSDSAQSVAAATPVAASLPGQVPTTPAGARSNGNGNGNGNGNAPAHELNSHAALSHEKKEAGEPSHVVFHFGEPAVEMTKAPKRALDFASTRWFP